MSERIGSTFRLAVLDLARGTDIRRDLAALERSQWWRRDALEKLQLAKARELITFAAAEVPFYRNLSLPDPRDWDAIEGLRTLPVMTKSLMKSTPDRFRCAGDRRAQTRRTGGSTGTPFTFLMEPGAISLQWAALFRAWSWAGYRLGDPMVTVGGGSVAPAGGGGLKFRTYNRLRNNRPLAAADLSPTAVRDIVTSLRGAPPRLLYGYPSVLYAVARHVLAEASPVPGVGVVVTTSEMLFARQRQAIEEAFGAVVHDQYGCNETNLVTCECERHEGYHVAMESAIVEILDEGDRPVPDGTVGRIVATGLRNRAMPFVRYDTGDLGALDTSACACGRGLVRIVALEGRSRDLVLAPDGRRIHGVAFNELVHDHPWVDRYQVVQESREDLVLRVETRADVGDDHRRRLVAAVRDLCAMEVRLQVNAPFETTSGAKARVVVSRLEEGS